MLRAVFFLTPFIIVLCGCQQAAWKAGANADDFQRDELACRKQIHNDDEIAQCLRDKGWHLANFEISEVPASNEAETPSPLTESVSGKKNARATDEPASSSAFAAPTDMVNPAAAIIAEKSTPKIDPLQRVSVQTWWKAGAQATDFQKDAGGCLTRLGEQHVPDYAQHLYTKAMVNCLHESGWNAGRDPVYTPVR